MKSFILFFTLFPIFSFATDKFCPIPEASVDFKIDVEVKNEAGFYIYNYTISNPGTNVIPIPFFSIETLDEPLEVISPKGWTWNAQNPKKGYRVGWTDYEKRLTPGSKVSGFSLKSKNPPGIVKVRVLGSNHGNTKLTNIPYTPFKTFCPGIRLRHSSGWQDPWAVQSTIGPVNPNRYSSYVYAKKSSEDGWYKGNDGKLKLSSTDENVDILITDNEGLDVSKIETGTLSFGRDNAKPIRTEMLKDLKKLKGLSLKEGKGLMLTFKTSEINALCDIDHSIFLEAKTSDNKEVFGALDIEREICNNENWKKEIPKIKGSDTSKYH